MSSEVQPQSPGLTGYINISLNALESAAEKVLPKGGNVIVPGFLGYMGGWISGVSTQVGLFQGVVSGVYHVTIHNLGEAYIKKNVGKGPYDLNQNAADFLRLIGVIGGISVPIFLTYQYGAPVMTSLLSNLSSEGWTRWALSSVPTREYSILAGICVNLAPAIAQHAISWARSEDPRKKIHIRFYH